MLQRTSYLDRVIPFINRDLVKVFTGIRRAGKSTLMEQVKDYLIATHGVAEDQILSINFEDLRQSTRTLESIHEEVLHHSQGRRIYVFFDEIQELPQWERLVNSLRVSADSDIYITGSNSKLLSGELSTLLSGRYVQIIVYPFSFREVTDFIQDRPNVTQEQLFSHYLRFGGFPFIYQGDLSERSIQDYLQGLYSSIVLNDIVRRYGIRDVELFDRMMAFFLDNVAKPFSANTLTKYLKNEKRRISNETIYNYIAYAQDALLLHRVPREDVKGKELIKFQEKLYLTDHGLREIRSEANVRDINVALENIVYVELLRRGYEVRVGRVDNREIDFVANRLNQRIYIQVAYLLADERVIEREFSAYRDVPDNYRKYVLSMDRVDFSRDGILHRNIVDWLLESDAAQ